MDCNLVVVHGAWCTSNSFNYVLSNLPEFDGQVDRFEYDCQASTPSMVVDRLERRLRTLYQTTWRKAVVVGHSLGGVIAAHVADLPTVKSTVTAAAPLAGIVEHPWLLSAFLHWHSPMLADLSPHSELIQALKRKTFNKPIDVCVASRGFNPWIVEPNDGVISIRAQTSWVPANANVQHLHVNHNEILLTDSFVSIVADALHR